MSRTATLVALAFIFAAGHLEAQLPYGRGYYLDVALWSDSTALSRGGVQDVQRLRLMVEPGWGPFSLDAAYEHVLTFFENRQAEAGGVFPGGVVPAGGEWLDLQWTVADDDRLAWRHRFDRLALTYSPDLPVRIAVGRQTISWATTLFLTPADPFAPFDPADPFREYRAGVDALRIHVYPGQFTDVDLVLRASDSPTGESLTALARGRTVWRGWELSAWAGALHEEPAAAIATTGALGQAALRGELSLREVNNDGPAWRGALGVDTRVDAFSRDLYLVAEYQHDDLGAADPEELLRVVESEPFQRGELQVLSRDVMAGEASYQVHPLLSAELLILWSLSDGSALLSPAVTYNLADEAVARAGLFFGAGNDRSSDGGNGSNNPLSVPSEFGLTPTILYASLSLFF